MRVIHLHYLPEDEPEVSDYYVELDEIGWENRRIERWADGHFERRQGVKEGEWPSVELLNENSGGYAREMEIEEFEALWQQLKDVPVVIYGGNADSLKSRE